MGSHGLTRDKMERPLGGAIICCTSILPEQRTNIATIAAQMGAEHKLDLTSDVTHLLVGNVDTPKYKYVAREREDVKVLRPDWVEAVRQAWMHAEELDVERLEKEYQLPTFHGLAICLTGFDNLPFRAQLAEQVSVHGGEYRGDLTKSVTHLIAYQPEGKKYQYAQQWGIKVVSLKWFKDSVERGMVLDEEDYHPTTPTAQQGLNAWNREAKTKVQPAKRPRESDSAPEPPRKLRRSASTRIGSQAESLWEDIVGNRDSDAKPRDTLRPSKSMSNVRSIVLEAKSFATDTTDPEAQSDSGPRESREVRSASYGFLSNISFALHGFSPQQVSVLQQHLRVNDATVVDSEWELTEHSNLRNFILVPYDISRSKIPPLDTLAGRVGVVTNLWLEKCILHKRFIEPGSHALDAPILLSPISGFERLVINSTAFEGIERLHVSKVVKTLGASYDEYFKPGISILVSNSKTPSEERLRHAAEWKIPVVTAEWLWACVRSGRIQPLKSYAIETSAQQSESKRRQMQTETISNVERRNRVTERQIDQPGADFKESESRNLKVQHEGGREPVQSAKRRDRPSRITPDFEDATPVRPLKEISPNSPQKRSKSPEKAKTIPALDGTSGLREEQSAPPNDLISINAEDGSSEAAATRSNSVNEALEQLLNKQKSNLQRSGSGVSRPPTSDDQSSRKKRLLGRALSNMSTSSSKSGRDGAATNNRDPAFSRASSVDSMNTDGIGSVIGDDISHPASEMSQLRNPAGGSTSFTGRASASLKHSTSSSLRNSNADLTTQAAHASHPPDLSTVDQSNAITTTSQDLASQPEPPAEEPLLTQLGYANPEDAVLLRLTLVDNKTTSTTTNLNSNHPKSTTTTTAATSSSTTTTTNNPKRIKDDVGIMSVSALTSAGTTDGVTALPARKTRMRDRRREKERERIEAERGYF